ncbi:MAG: DUF1015 domain-containing protein [Anaerolineae bacterium]|nr:DUF1015 domain-containing protein [Anaerolineae bacterium]
MAIIKPFRGVRYNTARIKEMSTVVSQPYDRITDELQHQYYDLNPYNIAHIIRVRAHGSSSLPNSNGHDVYERSKAYYRKWLDEGILIREEQPTLYAYQQTFSIGDRQYVRMGMIAAIRLTSYDEGIILPHERTHKGPREDRLKLLSAVEANTGQIFILYPDSENKVNALLRQAIGQRAPDIDVIETFENTVQQRVWIINDPGIIQAIQQHMAPMRNLIIADGHHRYSTSLAYRDMQRQAHPDAPPDAAFNYVQTTLVSMNDPGLVVLPTHREITNFTAISPQDVLDRARKYFDVRPVSNLDACLDEVNGHVNGHTFGFYGGPDTGYHVLTLTDNTLADTLIDDNHSREWKSLTVSILHKILLEQIAGVPVEGVEDKTMIRYHRDPQIPVQNVDQGAGNFVFFVRATRMDNIKACAAHGERMPQKSTDFYPKVISGLTVMPLSADERL